MLSGGERLHATVQQYLLMCARKKILNTETTPHSVIRNQFHSKRQSSQTHIKFDFEKFSWSRSDFILALKQNIVWKNIKIYFNQPKKKSAEKIKKKINDNGSSVLHT